MSPGWGKLRPAAGCWGGESRQLRDSPSLEKVANPVVSPPPRAPVRVERASSGEPGVSGEFERKNGGKGERREGERGGEAGRWPGRAAGECVCVRARPRDGAGTLTDRQTDRGLTLLAHVTYDTFSYIVVVRAGLCKQNVTKCYFYHH